MRQYLADHKRIFDALVRHSSHKLHRADLAGRPQVLQILTSMPGRPGLRGPLTRGFGSSAAYIVNAGRKGRSIDAHDMGPGAS